MLDIRFIRENPELVRENIRKKFQDKKLPLVDEVLELDEKLRAAKTEANELRANRNALSKKIGMLMGQAKKDPSKQEEAEDVKAEVAREAARLAELEKLEPEYEAELTKRMMVIPQMIDPSVPIGPDDSCNVEVQRFGEATVPDFEIPYHTEIMESFNGVDLDAARRVSGNGFYYLRPPALRGARVRARLYDRQGLRVLYSTLHDPRGRGAGRHVPDRHGRHDVQDRGRGSLSHRHERALHDRLVHRPHRSREGAPHHLHELFPLLPQGEGRARHRGARRLPHPPV